MVEVDVSDLWAWRTALKDAFEREHGVKLTLLPFFMFAVTEALRTFPMMNASFYDNGIAVHRHVNLGIATAAEATSWFRSCATRKNARFAASPSRPAP